MWSMAKHSELYFICIKNAIYHELWINKFMLRHLFGEKWEVLTSFTK